MSEVSLNLLVFKTHDVDRVRRFYEALGLTFTQEQHGSGPVHYSAPLGDGIMEIYPLPQDRTVDSSTRLGFAVSDPDSVLGAVVPAGGRVLTPFRETPWGATATLADPDGRTVEISRS